MPFVSPSASDFFRSWELLGGWPLFLFAISAFYLFGAVRLRRRGGRRAMSLQRIGFALTGYAALLLAVAGPFEVYSEQFFWAHMVQHLLIAIVAAPLILISNPMSAYIWALPRTMRNGAAELIERDGPLRKALKVVTNPKFALPVFILVFYAWHLSFLYEAALRSEGIHFLEHLSMFAFAVFFWWPLIGPAPLRTSLRHPSRIIYLLAAMTSGAALGAGITFSSVIFYSFYAEQSFGIAGRALSDQRTGGLLLWVPGNLIYMAALVATLWRWAEMEERAT